MAISSVTLLLGESRLCTMDFSALLARGETITAVASVSADLHTTPALLIGVATFSAGLVQFRVGGGLQDSRYKLTVFVTTSAGNTLDGEGYLQCRGPSSFVITPGAGGVGASGH